MSGINIVAEREGVNALLDVGVEFSVRREGQAYHILVSDEEYERSIKGKIRWSAGFISCRPDNGEKV